MPVISRDRPAYASSETYPATRANDADYASVWRSAGYPCWLAYDLSSVPPVERRQVYSEWSNISTYDYDSAVVSAPTYNLPGDYVIEGNPAPGGGASPRSGWTTLVAVTGNADHSAAHLLDMTGYTWLRFRATSGSSRNDVQNRDCAMNWDIHDASHGAQDSWMFYGDSITADAMAPVPSPPAGSGKAPDTFAKEINAARPGYFPAQQVGGVGGLTLEEAVGLIPKWLVRYPGRYVAVSFGANDANEDNFDANAFHDELVHVVKAVVDAGKVPVVPTLVASRTADIRRNGPLANAEIARLYGEHREVIPGPDLWALFTAHPEWISTDNLHPTETGDAELRRAWVSAALASVYAMPTRP